MIVNVLRALLTLPVLLLRTLGGVDTYVANTPKWLEQKMSAKLTRDQLQSTISFALYGKEPYKSNAIQELLDMNIDAHYEHRLKRLLYRINREQ